MNKASNSAGSRPPQWLVALVERIVQESGDPVGFDAGLWTSTWIGEPNAALGGRKPEEFLDSEQGRASIAGLVMQMQSGAYG